MTSERFHRGNKMEKLKMRAKGFKSKSFKADFFKHDFIDNCLIETSKINFLRPKSKKSLNYFKNLKKVIKKGDKYEMKKLKKFSKINLGQKLKKCKNLDQKCLEIFKIRKLLEKRTKIMGKVYDRYNCSYKNPLETDRDKEEIRRYIKDKRKREEENDDKNAQYDMEQRPNFELVKNAAYERDNWLDFSYNPKTTIELMKKIKKMQKVDVFLQKVDFIHGSRISEKLKSRTIDYEYVVE